MSMSRNLVKELAELLEECDAPVRFGLRAQGHLPTIERMLGEGATWDEIGKAIGWHGPTAERFYQMETEALATPGEPEREG
jgi:hypothetical protein